MDKNDYYKAKKLLKEIHDSMLYAPNMWDAFSRVLLNEVRASDIDSVFIKVMATLDALGILDPELNQIISTLIRDQIFQFYNCLYRKRRTHLLNGYVYSMSDVNNFIEQAFPLWQLLEQKVERLAAQKTVHLF